MKEKSKEVKRAKTGDGNFSHARSDRHGRSTFQKWFLGKGSSNSPPNFNKDRVFNPKPQVGSGGYSLMDRSMCDKCDKKHDGKCLADTD